MKKQRTTAILGLILCLLFAMTLTRCGTGLGKLSETKARAMKY